jgi:hypothetical protein
MTAQRTARGNPAAAAGLPYRGASSDRSTYCMMPPCR